MEIKYDEIGNPYIQYESETEFAATLGIDLETIEGDYAEAYQHCTKFWDKAKIDVKLEG